MNTLIDSSKQLLIIIPCYNEEMTILTLLEEIRACRENYKTIVIDDGSQDSTYQLAKNLSVAVHLIRNLGIGGAVQTGIKYAYRNNFDLCIQLDGDRQHIPQEIVKLLQAYNETQCSIIIGSRYLHTQSLCSSWPRRLGGKLIASILNGLFSQCSITDPTSGMRLMDRKAMALFSQHYPHDFPEPISLAWALKKGLCIGEVAIAMRMRSYGKSSIIGLKTFFYMFRVFGYIILARLMPTFL